MLSCTCKQTRVVVQSLDHCSGTKLDAEDQLAGLALSSTLILIRSSLLKSVDSGLDSRRLQRWPKEVYFLELGSRMREIVGDSWFVSVAEGRSQIQPPSMDLSTSCTVFVRRVTGPLDKCSVYATSRLNFQATHSWFISLESSAVLPGASHA
jgi:hypothetical protein